MVLYIGTAVKCSFIFSELKRQCNVYPQSLVFGFPLSRKLDLSRKVWFPATYFQHKVIRQSSVQISLITQKFSASFFKNIKRKNRSEAFCVSSENILHLTFCGLKMWRKPNTKPTQIYTKL